MLRGLLLSSLALGLVACGRESVAVGAIMDEHASAAEEYCRVLETFSRARFDEERPSDDPDTVSVGAICRLLRHRRQLERWR